MNEQQISLEDMLGLKLSLCQKFASDNDKLFETLYTNDWLIYEVGYSGIIDKDIIVDTTRPFPLTYPEYKKAANEAYQSTGRDFIQADYWRA